MMMMFDMFDRLNERQCQRTRSNKRWLPNRDSAIIRATNFFCRPNLKPNIELRHRSWASLLYSLCSKWYRGSRFMFSFNKIYHHNLHVNVSVLVLQNYIRNFFDDKLTRNYFFSELYKFDFEKSKWYPYFDILESFFLFLWSHPFKYLKIHACMHQNEIDLHSIIFLRSLHIHRHLTCALLLLYPINDTIHLITIIMNSIAISFQILFGSSLSNAIWWIKNEDRSQVLSINFYWILYICEGEHSERCVCDGFQLCAKTI